MSRFSKLAGRFDGVALLAVLWVAFLLLMINRLREADRPFEQRNGPVTQVAE